VDPGTSHLEQLEVAERQLLVFAREINHLYQAGPARPSWSGPLTACAVPTWT
jgi:hypothetical protein